MSNESVEFECKTEDIMIIGGVPYDEGAVWFVAYYLLCSVAAYWSPVPAVLHGIQGKMSYILI